MLLVAANGYIAGPVNYDGDQAKFTLRENGHHYQILASGREMVKKIRAIERTGEFVFVFGYGESYQWQTCKKHHFCVRAAAICPLSDIVTKFIEKSA